MPFSLSSGLHESKSGGKPQVAHGLLTVVQEPRAHPGPLIKAHERGRRAGRRNRGQRPARRRVHPAHDRLQRRGLQSTPRLMG